MPTITREDPHDSYPDKLKQFFGPSEEKFTWKDRDLVFRSIIGGIAWPNEKPGFAVVLGEQKFGDPGKKRKIYLVAEAEEKDTGDLIQRCTEFIGDLQVQAFYTRFDEAKVMYLSQWNQQAVMKRARELEVDKAPFSKDTTGRVDYHVNLIRDKLRRTGKSLYFNTDSRLPGELSQIEGQREELTDIKNPAVAALGYALAAIVVLEPGIVMSGAVNRTPIDKTIGY